MFNWLFGTKKFKFKDVFISEKGRYSIGIEEVSRKYYLSIPVSNQTTDYEEYYKIDRTMFERFKVEPNLAINFANRCRNREMDHLLIVKPGQDRGSPS